MHPYHHWSCSSISLSRHPFFSWQHRDITQELFKHAPNRARSPAPFNSPQLTSKISNPSPRFTWTGPNNGFIPKERVGYNNSNNKTKNNNRPKSARSEGGRSYAFSPRQEAQSNAGAHEDLMDLTDILRQQANTRIFLQEQEDFLSTLRPITATVQGKV